MSENPTPTPPEQNPSSDPATPTSRRELRTEPADPPTVPPAAPVAPAVPAPPVYAAPEQPADPAYAVPAAPVAPAAPVVTVPDFGPAREPLEAPADLDEGTYDKIREPRKEGLALDGTWHQISKKYVVSQIVQELFWLVVVMGISTVIAVTTETPWSFIPGGVISVGILLGLIILPRQAKALGYMLRGDDVVFRKGILWQRVVAVPYGRMQLIDITHGPLDRIFGVAKLKMVTAAASTGIEIPGLTTAAAEALRDTLIEVAETRRTGL